MDDNTVAPDPRFDDSATPEQKVRMLRIHRAVCTLVLHGLDSVPRGYHDGFNAAVEELFVVEDATPGEFVPMLRWALARIPKGWEEPEMIREHALLLTSWIEAG